MILIYSQAEDNSAVRLQCVEPESSAQEASQYEAIYQALDPKSLDWAGFSLCL